MYVMLFFVAVVTNCQTLFSFAKTPKLLMLLHLPVCLIFPSHPCFTPLYKFSISSSSSHTPVLSLLSVSLSPYRLRRPFSYENPRSQSQLYNGSILYHLSLCIELRGRISLGGRETRFITEEDALHVRRGEDGGAVGQK